MKQGNTKSYLTAAMNLTATPELLFFSTTALHFLVVAMGPAGDVWNEPIDVGGGAPQNLECRAVKRAITSLDPLTTNDLIS